MNDFILLQNEVDKISNNLLNYFLPLYNSLYKSILDEYNSINNIQEINQVDKKAWYNSESISENDTIYSIDKKENQKKYEKNKKKNMHIYQKL